MCMWIFTAALLVKTKGATQYYPLVKGWFKEITVEQNNKYNEDLF